MFTSNFLFWVKIECQVKKKAVFISFYEGLLTNGITFQEEFFRMENGKVFSSAKSKKIEKSLNGFTTN